MEKKILVAVDGSVYSINSIRYLAYLFEKLEDVKLHLVSYVSATATPAAKDWMHDDELMNSVSPDTKNRFNKGKSCLNEALIQLARHGFSPEQVTTEAKFTRSSIANDIIHEAQKGLYDALVIGRRGIGKLEELFMGSVSSTILEKEVEVPVWIIDGRVNSRKFLVPVDGSQASLRAVDHVAHILKDNPYAEVTLFHSRAMLANVKEVAPHECAPQFGEDWCDLHTTGDDRLFSAPEQLLFESGFSTERVHRLTTETGVYPSRQIVRQALMDEFGTIVMGRRENIKRGIFKGTLEKVIGMAVDTAIWVVG